ncbi:hypothetical protein QQF64_025658 [Cirrhinus molitorella]|uniref:Transmembrane protein n=1 Tax=Cirrhinus molitorella TaxID=172907 RepID=A0ABR3NPK6_9TELE
MQTLGVRLVRNSRDSVWIRVAALQTSLFNPQQLRTSSLRSFFSFFFFSFLPLPSLFFHSVVELRPAVMVRGAVPAGRSLYRASPPIFPPLSQSQAAHSTFPSPSANHERCVGVSERRSSRHRVNLK